jgi:hypothetical protein
VKVSLKNGPLTRQRNLTYWLTAVSNNQACEPFENVGIGQGRLLHRRLPPGIQELSLCSTFKDGPEKLGHRL